MKYWAMTPEDGEEFFNRCIMREAVTEKERLVILDELMAERSNIKSGDIPDTDGSLADAVARKRVIGIRYDDDRCWMCGEYHPGRSCDSDTNGINR